MWKAPFGVYLLRDEPRRGAAVGVRAGHDPHAEPSTDAEAPVRGAVKRAIIANGKLVARAINVQLFPAGEAFRMNQNDRTHGDTGEAVLVGHKDLACVANGTSTVPHTELGSDN